MYEELERFLSKEKLKPYLKCEQDKEKAITLFTHNLELSCQLYKILQIFELSTRNIFNDFLMKRYGYDWINRKDILSGNNGKNTKLINDIEAIKFNFKNEIKKNSYNNNDIISNLSLGFWVNLLSFDNNDKIWQPSLKKIFDCYDRIVIQDIFRDVKDIRNRIAHHETVLFKNIEEIKNNTLFILKIYSETLYEWTLKNIDTKIFRELDNKYQQPCPKSTN